MIAYQTKCRLAPKLAVAALACGAALAATSADAAINYTFTTLNNQADPTFNQLLGINNSGVIAGYFGSGLAGHPNKGYLLLPPYGQLQYANENVPNSVQTQVTGLNNTGTTVGFFSNTNNGPPNDANTAFSNTGGVTRKFYQVVDPNTPNVPIEIEQLLGVNDKGVAVGFYTDAAGAAHGFTFNTLTWSFSSDINAPFASSTTAAAINDKGVIAGFDSVGTVQQGFIDTNGTFKTVIFPNAASTVVLGVNDYGLAVGDYVDQQNLMHGFTYNSKTGVFQSVDDPNGVGTTTINGVNDLGELVGFYVDGNNFTDGFLARDPAAVGAPEASTWAMMMLGFAALGFAGYRGARTGAAFAA